MNPRIRGNRKFSVVNLVLTEEICVLISFNPVYVCSFVKSRTIYSMYKCRHACRASFNTINWGELFPPAPVLALNYVLPVKVKGKNS